MSSVARVDFVWDPRCDDGSAFIGYASIEDTNCDGRSAQAFFDIYDGNIDGTYTRIYHSNTFKVTNGCGYWASIPDLRPPSPGTLGWRVRVVMQACSWSCSWTEEDNFYG